MKKGRRRRRGITRSVQFEDKEKDEDWSEGGREVLSNLGFITYASSLVTHLKLAN